MEGSLKLNIRRLFKLALVVSLPLFTLLILGWFLIPIFRAYIKEVLAFGFLTLVFFSFILLFLKAKTRKLLTLIAIGLLSLFNYIKLSFYHIYEVNLSASALFVIFESDTRESKDFLSNYFDKTNLLLAVLCLVVVPFVAYRLLKRINLKANFKFIKIVAFIAIVASGYLINSSFKSENIVVESISAYKDFAALQEQLKSDLAKPTSSFIEVEKKTDYPETHVVIIGEATTSWHMQLYGYDRPTNPKLTQIRDQLLVFDSVITPNVHTIVALDKILTFSDYNNPNKTNNTSVVQLANQADFTTYWISNQRPVGFHERISSIIGTAADETYFVATSDSDDEIYDEMLLPALDLVLQKPAKKKLVFMHLIGTHGKYNRRYPKSFEIFKSEKENLKFKHKKAALLVNYYDNATLYNDFVVRQVIEKVRHKNINSYVAYFSDHGDDVYDTMEDYAGHNEYRATRPMYEIPFIVWFSKTYKANNPNFEQYKTYQKRAYNLEDFQYTFSDLSGITFKTFDSTKSIFSTGFIRKPRIIRKNQVYNNRLKKLEH